MKSILLLLGLAIAKCGLLSGQPLQNINYSYLYQPESPFTFSWSISYEGDNAIVLFDLKSKAVSSYTIAWETRRDIKKKDGMPLSPQTDLYRTNNEFSGSFTLKTASTDSVLVARITNSELQLSWFFYKRLQDFVSVEGYLSSGPAPVTASFVQTGEQLSLHGIEGDAYLTTYDENFPPASPPHAEGVAQVSSLLTPSSTVSISGENNLTPESEGLYLIQKDTSATKGFAFLAESDYPKFSTLKNLIGPLIYVCTRHEFEVLTQAPDDKRNFDRVILNMTGDTDRARQFIRNYFRRVEMANLYFTSYKEGWKTDRGMMYIIFGPPDEVYLFEDRETWLYKEDFDFKCSFMISSTLFDPENLVLIREKKFEDLWYRTIDLWRKARF